MPGRDRELHSWVLNPQEAMRLQLVLRDRLITTWDNREIRTVAGVDVHFKRDWATGAAVVLCFPEMTLLDVAIAHVPAAFPYIPGLLAFREGPAVLAAWDRLKLEPDLVMFDAQGVAHPRRFGLASHMGLWLGRPSIGVAKSRLCGRHKMPGPNRGDAAELIDEHDPGCVLGMVLRTQVHLSPLYISIGHLIDLEHAVALVLKCAQRDRLPEPTRWAHQVASTGMLPRGFG